MSTSIEQEHRYEWFVRRVVEHIDRYQDQGIGQDLTPEAKVNQAKLLTDGFMETSEGIELSDENAVRLAAIIATFDSPFRPDDITPMTPEQIAWVRAQRGKR